MKRSIVAVLTCIVLLVSAAACSLGGSDSNESAEGGDGGAILRVYALNSIDGQLEKLAESYKKDSPDTTIEFTFGPAEELAQKIIDGETPDVFIARPAQVVTVKDAGKTQAGPVLLGFDVLQIVTPRDNPAAVEGLEAFGEGSGVITGLCTAELTCGRNAVRSLENAGITPGQAIIEPDGRSLLDKIIAGEIEAGMLYRTQSANKLKEVTIVPIPEDNAGRLDYQVVQISPNGNGAAFVEWVKDSKTAADLLKSIGLRPLLIDPTSTTPASTP